MRRDADSADPSASRRRTPPSLLVFVAVAILSAAVVVTAVLARRPLTIVEMAGNLPFLDDREVVETLRDAGVEVRQTQFGSRQAADRVDLSKYDIVVSGSAVQARLVEKQLGPNVATAQWFASPMVVATSAPIAELLKSIGLASPNGDGTWTFDVDPYLREVRAGRRWMDIGRDGGPARGAGSAPYPSPNRMLVTTTDPQFSNSAAMFVAIASFVLNKGNVVADEGAVQRVLPGLAMCFGPQGDMPLRTSDLMSTFLVGGEYAVPMALVYENDVITAHRREPTAAANMVTMYPSPNILSDNTLTMRTDVGRRLGRLLVSDERMQRLARHWGYRNTSSAEFIAQMSADGIVVGQQMLTIKPPTYQVLNRLIDGITPK